MADPQPLQAMKVADGFRDDHESTNFDQIQRPQLPQFPQRLRYNLHTPTGLQLQKLEVGEAAHGPGQPCDLVGQNAELRETREAAESLGQGLGLALVALLFQRGGDGGEKKNLKFGARGAKRPEEGVGASGSGDFQRVEIWKALNETKCPAPPLIAHHMCEADHRQAIVSQARPPLAHVRTGEPVLDDAKTPQDRDDAFVG